VPIARRAVPFARVAPVSDFGREIAASVRENAVFLGVEGDIVVRGTWLEVHGAGAPVAIDITDLVARWPSLSVEMRRTEGYALAKRVVAERSRAPQGAAEVELAAAPPPRRDADAAFDLAGPPPEKKLPLGEALRSPGALDLGPSPAGARPSAPSGPAARGASSAPSREAPPVAVVASEVEQVLRDQLGHHGVSGTVYVRGKQVELHGRGAPVSIDIDVIIDQWPLLPHEMRQRKLGEVVRRLVAAQSGPVGRGEDAPSIWSSIPVWVPMVGGLFVAVMALYFFRGALRELVSGPPPKPDAGVATETDDQARARRSRACDAARRRMREGAPIGVLPEGWVTEIWLATSKATGDLKKHPSVTGLVDRGRVAKAVDPLLAGIADGTVEVVDGFAPQDAEKSSAYKAVIVRFGGLYFEKYLDLADRQRFIDIANKLSEELPAEMTAVYGRCEHLAYHDVGAFYRGADLGALSASLVFSAGFFAEPSAVNRSSVGSLGTGGELDNLRAAAAKLDQPTVSGLVGPQGGTLSTTASKALTMMFPAAGPTRATLASRALAKKLGVGSGAD
jgi:serine/threonine-protein kinase